MRKIREVLRLKRLGRSQREIASSVATAVGTVCGQLRRARKAGLTWERAQELSDSELEAMLFRDAATSPQRVRVSTTRTCTANCTRRESRCSYCGQNTLRVSLRATMA